MPIKTLSSSPVLTTGLINGNALADSNAQGATQKLQQIRNATVKVSYGDTTFLVDPMLAEQGTYPGFENTYRSELRNPLVGLPMPIEEIIDGVDAIIVTHTHLDHWDDAAQQLLPKDLPLFTQNASDAELIRSQGFNDVRILDGKVEFGGVTLHKTGGQHGSDTLYSVPELAQLLGEVMGVVFEAPEHKTTYLVGDTIWRDEVEQTLARYNPEVIVVNAGAAEITGFSGDPIIMGKQDTLRMHQAAPNASIIAVHMGAVNHMTLNREELSDYVQEVGIQDRVSIPADGQIIAF
ncbi:MBL fold metallo-hydrolase [Vreelandella venusta]|uniref:MBL fold metallo-hydrolase n=1 Tax=Vreelandella venusta TaxID=44935 RepID=UPI0022857B02|nr:MBL fold metallo-hydrolase [Halomonas venusta]WAM47118.1 MBL fold metallo-hydrolase [Halomonas venusta]